jgi:FSR family fosmidomycin resistance protein-like MFS transporter
VLLAVLSGPLGLTNTQIGTAITLYMLAGSLSQPLFGWLTDKLPEHDQPGSTGLNALHLVSVGIIWMAVFFSAVVFVSSWTLVLVCILLASLGSGLFHPIGTGYVSTLKTGSTNTWTAVFFLGGQSGLALGPIVGGILFDVMGISGILPLAALTLIPAVLMGITVHRGQAAVTPAPTAPTAGTEAEQVRLLTRLLSFTVLAFFLLVASRSSMQAVYQFLIPKLFEDRGWDASLYGLLTGIFMGTAAVGNVIMGKLVDRFGMRLVAVTSLLLSVPVGLFFLTTPAPGLVFITCALAGMLIGGQHSMLVVHAQRLLPVRKGLAAGLILGFTFASGALGTWLCGIAADSYTLQSAMQTVTLLGIPSALLALLLPGRDTDSLTVPVASPPAAAEG